MELLERNCTRSLLQTATPSPPDGAEGQRGGHRDCDDSFTDIDQTTTTAQEIKAWVCLGVALEPMAVIAFSTFFPILIQNLAAESGWDHSDHSLKCDTSGSYNCDVLIGTTYFSTGSIILLGGSISTLIQVVIFVSLSKLADYHNYRKWALFTFSFLLLFISSLMVTVVDASLWWWALIISVLGNSFGGLTYLFFISFLPIYTRWDCRTVSARADPAVSSQEEFKVVDKVGNELSGKSLVWAFGSVTVWYIITFVVLGIVGVDAKWGLPKYYVLCIATAVFGAFGAIVILVYSVPFFRARPGPSIPSSGVAGVFKDSFRSLRTTFTRSSQLPQMPRFLLA
ncbi:Autophagy protein 22, partial [Kappamyces sp. JEL0680]